MHMHGEIKVLSKEELKKKIDEKEKFVLIEVLAEEEYAKGHLPNAINIPLDKFPERAEKELHREDEIVLYCSDFSCHSSANAAHFLLHMGFTKIFEFAGGKRDWVNANYPIEKS